MPNECSHDKIEAVAADLPLRRAKLQSVLRECGADAALFTGNANLLYATGSVFDGFCYVPAEGEAWVFLRSGKPIGGGRIARVSRPEMIPQILGDSGVAPPKRIALECDEISHREWTRLSKLFFDAEVLDVPIARKARMVKTDYEVETIARDAATQAKLYEGIPRLYREGMREIDLAAAAEHELRKNGHLGLFRTFGFRMEAHMGSVLAGDNACAPSPYDFALGGAGLHPSAPIGANGTVLKPGMSVMIDLSGNYSGYPIDITRTFSIGKLPQKAYDLHAISLEILHDLAERGKPGALCSELYERAQQIVSHHHAEEYFMGCEKQAKFVGHGFGLEINELPVVTGKYREPLQNNMTIALEPKFTIPGIGAVGAENSYVVEASGMRCLTNCEENIVDLLEMA